MLASIDFSALALAGSAGFALCLSLAVSLIASMLGLVWTQSSILAHVRYDMPVVGDFRVAKDGRSYVRVGRVCYFGRRNEDEGSLRARLAARGVL